MGARHAAPTALQHRQGIWEKRSCLLEDIYNNFCSTHGGLVVGVDTSFPTTTFNWVFLETTEISISNNIQVLTKRRLLDNPQDLGRSYGSYWEDNFYLGGLLAPPDFSGDNKRQVQARNSAR